MPSRGSNSPQEHVYADYASQRQGELKRQKERTAELNRIAEDDAERAAAHHERGEEIKAEIDDILDDIEAVLQDSAFVQEYVQQGGE